MKAKEILVENLDGLKQAAASLLSDTKEQRVFAINGKMGAGKTTFIKELCDFLGVEEIVTSPTFSIVNEYTDSNGESVFHFDFYRIKKPEEAFDIGFEEYVYSGDYCFIEWPELIEDLLPESYSEVNIEVLDNKKRLIKYTQ